MSDSGFFFSDAFYTQRDEALTYLGLSEHDQVGYMVIMLALKVKQLEQRLDETTTPPTE